MVLTLAVGIGATTIIYSTIDVVQHVIPAVNRSRLVYIASTDTRVIQQGPSGQSVVLRTWASVPDLADWTARSTTIDQFGGFAFGSANLTGVDVPMRVSAIRITVNLGELWGIGPAVGRGFLPSDGRIGSEGVTLLSDRFWRRQFAGDAAVLERSLLLDGKPHTIVGILPPQAATGLLRDADLFTPLVVDPLRGARDARTVLVTARLKDGVTREQAAADLEAIARQLQSEHPETNERVGAAVLPLIEASGFNVRVLLFILGLIAVLVLVVACANVANVVVAQSIARRHEFAVRAALGGSRFDRVRQLMTESMLVSAVAGAAGLELAVWGIAGLRWMGGSALGLAELQMNGRVLAAGVAAAFVAPLGFGLLPAIRMPAPDGQDLKDTDRTAGVSRQGRRARTAIVALQAAASMILMVQIALFLRTTWNLSDMAIGFDPAQVLTFRVGLSGPRYESPDAINRFAADLVSRLRSVPGVASAGISSQLPIADSEPTARLTVEGTAPAPLETRPIVARSAVGGDFFPALRIPVTRGRMFSESDETAAARVALINEEAARRFWPGADPLGSRLALDAPAGQEQWLQIVGVVGNVRNADADQVPLPQVYIAIASQPAADIAVVVRSVGRDPLGLVPAIRTQIAAIDRDQPVHDVASMSQVLFDDLASTYVLATLLTVVGLVALSLSAAGIYGIVAYSIAQRRRELGVRMALGAQPGVIVRMVVAQGSRPVAIGSVIGLAAAITLAFTIAAAVPELDARDPLNYIAVAATIASVAFAASYLPARRAASIDPVQALRQE
jgi:predicted permease